MSGEQRKFELTGPQIVGSALAAVTVAVAASYLGVAGTVIGAALMSAGTTVGTAVYTHYLKRTGAKVKKHTVTAWHGHLAEKEPSAGQSTPGATPEPAQRGKPSWIKVAVAAALVFAVSMGGILAYQAVAGQTVADQITGKPRQEAKRDKPPLRQHKHVEPALQPPATQPAMTPSGHVSPRPTATTPTPTAQPASTPTSTPEPSGSPSPAPSQSPPEGTAETPPPGERPPSQQPEPADPQPTRSCLPALVPIMC
ncbi:hypothetical protein ACTMTF_01410 [Nonomuraea sp. ZG12]|uniref:hypothetical protein n=1 Tax=Nonomuraea sp. ZG12 TaxID=3452207 RepID=UPI003F89B3C4